LEYYGGIAVPITTQKAKVSKLAFGEWLREFASRSNQIGDYDFFLAEGEVICGEDEFSRMFFTKLPIGQLNELLVSFLLPAAGLTRFSKQGHGLPPIEHGQRARG
jgi:hypothetical protein